MGDQLWHDVRLACRGLRRAKGFAAVALLTLSVGLTAAMTMFAVAAGVLLAPLPLVREEQLLVMWKELPTSPGRQWPIRAADVAVLNDGSRTVARAASYGYQDPVSVAAFEDDEARYLNLSRVSGDFFEVLGAPAFIGRTLTGGDDAAGAAPVAVLSHAFWRRQYGGSPAALGRRLVLNEHAFTIVGVMVPDVEFPRGVEAWVTARRLAATIATPAFRLAAENELRVVARLRDDATVEQAASELRAIAPRLDVNEPPGGTGGLTVAARPLREAIVGDVRASILVLSFAVALLLLVAAANVANLLLLRGESRRVEMALRAALGAGRARLTRQLVTESAVLAAAAGALGTVATWTILPAVLALVPGGLTRVEAVRIDYTVALFGFAAAFVVAACAALAPTVSSTRAQHARELADGGRTVGAATRQGRRFLVVAQVALAVIVLGASGLLARSILQMHAVGAELAADDLLFVPLLLPVQEYADPERRLRFLTRAMTQLQSVPGITSATPVNTEPFSGIGWDVPTFTVEGRSVEQAERNAALNLEAIHPNYFGTLEVEIVRGRAFTDADRQGRTPVAIVSEDVAAQTWPGEDPIGKRLKMGGLDSTDPWRAVVGVTRPTRYRDIRERRATLYVPAEQLMVSARMLVVRTSAPPAAVGPIVVGAIRAVDPDVRVLRVAPFDDLLDGPLARPRFNALLAGTFGAVGLFLAAVGLYAVMAAFVRMRQREIGVRMALGATTGQIRRLVVGEAGRLTAAGAVIGLVIGAAANQGVRGLLFEIGPWDPAALIVPAVSLVLAAVAACYLPVRRATRTDPAVMLRAE